MSIGPRLDLRTSQQLVLTPQLQQAIKLLQMANLELQAFVAQEMERNPLLEREDPEAGGEEENGEPVHLSGFDSEAGIYAADGGMSGDGMMASGDAPLDADYETNVFDDAPVDSAGGSTQLALGTVGGGHGFEDGDGDGGFESRLVQTPDLKTHLAGQMTALLDSPVERMIAAYLIDLLDDGGYLGPELEEVPARLGCTVEEVELVLERLQTLEPTGVFARSLGECLALQLKERGRFDPAMAALVENLDLLAQRDFPALKRLCGVDDEDLAEMVQEIRALEPRPGRAFGGEDPQTLIPDVFVRRLPSGAWGVELNSESLPRVLVNRHYYAELNRRTGTKRDKQFLSECLSNASWLVRSLDQRARTILKVSSEIVRRQEGFLTHGVRHLKPLTLRDIAEAISMHESTVSRVTSSKYMATPRGIFEFKYFFTSALASSGGGEAHSSEAVRDRIRTLIEGEDPRRILSDDRIVALLAAEGIEIARRTVAKYREAMRIPSSVERRRLKRLEG